MSSLPPLADPIDGDGYGSYDTDELDAIKAHCYATGYQQQDAERYAAAVQRIVAETDRG